MRVAHEMPFGAQLLDGGGVRFRLWAPAAQRAELVLEPGTAEQVVAAERADAGWWEAVVRQAGEGSRYQWAIDGELRVPDPGSRFNPQGPHGPSMVVDPRAFEWDEGWNGRPWHEVVLYELHVGCFTPEGSYAAAEGELDRLAALGVTAVQLMPLADWPGRFGWGYDGVLPFAPHAAYGTPDELKHFIQAAHRRGLMVFVDVVYNHFGPDGNYLHRYAPQFFSPRHKTAWGAAINFDGEGCEVVRSFFIHNARYWIEEYRVDGLRFDAVHAMVDDRRPDIVEELSHALRSSAAGRHVHLVLENDSNDCARLARPATPGRFDGQWNGDFHHVLHVQLTGERDGYYAEYDKPVDQLAKVLVDGFAREGGPHNSEHARPRREAQSRAPLSATVNFLQNHDQIGNRAFGERLAALADPEGLRLAMAICLLGVSPPMLFMGEEFGAKTPFLYFADWSGELREAVRQGRREEFSHFPRYAKAAERGELPDPCSAETFERCRLDAARLGAAQEGREWQRLCGELLALRQRELWPHLPALSDDGHRSWRYGAHGLVVRWRFDGGRLLQLCANLGNTPQRLQPPPLPQPSLMYAIGAAVGEEYGRFAARWHWGREA